MTSTLKRLLIVLATVTTLPALVLGYNAIQDRALERGYEEASSTVLAFQPPVEWKDDDDCSTPDRCFVTSQDTEDALKQVGGFLEDRGFDVQIIDADTGFGSLMLKAEKGPARIAVASVTWPKRLRRSPEERERPTWLALGAVPPE
jgi:hypothetical protein